MRIYVETEKLPVILPLLSGFIFATLIIVERVLVRIFQAAANMNMRPTSKWTPFLYNSGYPIKV
jgi:hypothetical protein